MVSFNSIPSTLRVPIFSVEFASHPDSQGAILQPYQLLVVGQRTSGGSVAALTPTVVTSVEQAATYFGAGSMLHGMARALFLNNKVTKAVFVALADLGGGTVATGQIVYTGPATAAGTLYLYIAGHRLALAVLSGNTAGQVAAGVAAAVNADTSLPVTAAASTGTVTFTAKNKGTLGNGLDIRHNYYTGEALPAGIGATITAMASGAGDPDVSTVWAVIGSEQYNVWAFPYTDSANIGYAETELADRWGPLRMIEGFACGAKDASHANLLTLGNSRNSKHMSIMGFEKSPTPNYEWAAAIAGTVANYGSIDPARPFRTLPLTGVLPPTGADVFTFDERNLLLFDGISTFTVDPGGQVRIERLITTYQVNEVGAADTSYLDSNRPLTLGYLRYDLRNYFLLKYPRHKLANDGTRFGPGQAILTPLTAKAEVLGRFRVWESLGLVENFDQFQRELVVERNGGDPNRLDFYLPADLIDQFLIGAAQINFVS